RARPFRRPSLLRRSSATTTGHDLPRNAAGQARPSDRHSPRLANPRNPEESLHSGPRRSPHPPSPPRRTLPSRLFPRIAQRDDRRLSPPPSLFADRNPRRPPAGDHRVVESLPRRIGLRVAGIALPRQAKRHRLPHRQNRPQGGSLIQDREIHFARELAGRKGAVPRVSDGSLRSGGDGQRAVSVAE